MDKLAERLRRDADDIDVKVSAQLDNRIAASLRRVAAEKPRPVRRTAHRPAMFWWASSITGIAAAAAVIVIINVQRPVERTAPLPSQAVITAAIPAIDWKTETATLTGPLQQELVDLQSDIRKAEERVRQDIGL